MARNLSEQLLDMVERDPRFIGLHAATIIVWLKVLRLFRRKLTAKPPTETTWAEMAHFVRLSEDRLQSHLDLLHAHGLLRYGGQGGFIIPSELDSAMFRRPVSRRPAKGSEPAAIEDGRS
jgi:hypothetical protein